MILIATLKYHRDVRQYTGLGKFIHVKHLKAKSINQSINPGFLKWPT